MTHPDDASHSAASTGGAGGRLHGQQRTRPRSELEVPATAAPDLGSPRAYLVTGAVELDVATRGDVSENRGALAAKALDFKSA